MKPISVNAVIVEPKAFLIYLNKGNPPDISFVDCVLLLYNKSLVKFVRQFFNTVKIKGFTSDCYLIGGKVLISCGFGEGSPAAVVAIEELCASGAKRFISIGTAGGISSHLKLGDIVVCTKALIDEGTSSHYIINNKFSFPHTAFTKEVIALLNNHFKTINIGTTWTTDAPFRETLDKFTKHQKKGIQTVEMEASALFTLGQFHNIEVASVFVIGDLLSQKGWLPGFSKKLVQSTCKQVVNVILKNYLSGK